MLVALMGEKMELSEVLEMADCWEMNWRVAGLALTAAVVMVVSRELMKDPHLVDLSV